MFGIVDRLVLLLLFILLNTYVGHYIFVLAPLGVLLSVEVDTQFCYH